MSSWNDGGPRPSTYSRPWDELTLAVQDAAKKMGYHEDTWNGCAGTTCLDRYRYVQQRVMCPHGFFTGKYEVMYMHQHIHFQPSIDTNLI